MALSGARIGSNLSTGAFVPQVYSAKMQDKFYASSAVASIANTAWQGDINGFGDKVVIRKVPTVNISDYSVNAPITYQDISDEQIILNIDQQKFYAFRVDYIDDYQSDLALIEKITEDASWQMKVAVDKAVLQGIPASIALANTVGWSGSAVQIGTSTAIPLATLTAANSLQPLQYAQEVLDYQNVPRDGERWAVISNHYANILKQGPLAQAYFTGDTTSPIRNGLIGEIDGLKVYMSNNILNANGTSGAPSNCLVGHKSALAFASQFMKHRQLELPDTFGWGISGLNVFGYKLVKPEAAVLVPLY
jgi:hypothetical protein